MCYKLIKIFEAGLLTFINEKYPVAHRFMQDNDPKHTSGLATEFLEEKQVNWWKNPPESPDLNPIENVWGSLKRFLRDHHKPHNQATLIEGITIFWKTMTHAVCESYSKNYSQSYRRAWWTYIVVFKSHIVLCSVHV